MATNIKIPSTKPSFDEDDITYISSEIQSILRNGRLILGPYTQKFENDFKEYVGTKYAVAVNSCTAALEITLRYLDVKDAEVIVPTNTFLATSNSVIYSGGTPVLADIQTDTLCLEPSEITRRLTKKTRGVIVVHLAGFPHPRIEVIRNICQEAGLFLIEDVAHAHGATIDGRKTGSFSNAGCFSFYPTKVMTTGTGGMITTNDEQLADYAISLRHHGVGKDLHDLVNLGNDWMMNEISAVLGIYQLKKLEDNLTKRNMIAQEYNKALSKISAIELFKVPDNIRHSYYKYPILLKPGIDRRLFVNKMQEAFGISIGSVYNPPCHLQPVYQRLFGFGRGMFPVAEDVCERICCLPMYPQLTLEEISYIVQSISSVLPVCSDTIKKTNDNKHTVYTK